MSCFPLGDGSSSSRLRLKKKADSDKICLAMNHHRGQGSIRFVDYLLPINHKLESITGGTVPLPLGRATYCTLADSFS